MKKRAMRPMVKINKKVHIIHLNVGAGYVTYLEEDVAEDCVRVKGIVVDRGRSKKEMKA